MGSRIGNFEDKKNNLELLTSNIQLINLNLSCAFFLKVLGSPQKKTSHLYFGHRKEFSYKFSAELGSQKRNTASTNTVAVGASRVQRRLLHTFRKSAPAWFAITGTERHTLISYWVPRLFLRESHRSLPSESYFCTVARATSWVTDHLWGPPFGFGLWNKNNPRYLQGVCVSPTVWNMAPATKWTTFNYLWLITCVSLRHI